MGHFNYSVTLTQQNIPHLDLTYGGSSWSASLKATGVTMGNMVQATSDNDNYINYYSTSGAHTSSEVTFDALNDFTTSYTGQNLPITGTTQTLTTMVLPSIAIKYIIKAQ
jgi:hypothetical protein